MKEISIDTVTFQILSINMYLIYAILSDYINWNNLEIDSVFEFGGRLGFCRPYCLFLRINQSELKLNMLYIIMSTFIFSDIHSFLSNGDLWQPSWTLAPILELKNMIRKIKWSVLCLFTNMPNSVQLKRCTIVFYACISQTLMARTRF